jgi:CRISPR-associated protein Cmr4
MNICQRYFAQALDPIHVGTGGYRLGRVDLPIQREPGTNVPKVPGTALEGCARAFAALRAKPPRPRCAGQGQPREKENWPGHCGACEICRTFGFALADQRGALKGLAHFFDAQLLWMPVYSRVGPVWVTSPLLLEPIKPPSCILSEGDWPGDTPLKELLVSPDLIPAAPSGQQRNLNLGWLKLPVQGELSEKQMKALRTAGQGEAETALNTVLKRLVIVPDGLLAQIVNSNLEVRTSVSIDPRTGAAEEGALFTYEALPRGSWLTFEIVYSDPELFEKVKGKITPGQVQTVVKGALEYFEYFGVGGMNTRGFGRLKIWTGGPNHGTF